MFYILNKSLNLNYPNKNTEDINYKYAALVKYGQTSNMNNQREW